MLAGKRSVRVGEQILKEIALLLLHEVKDPRVKGVTMTGIRMSEDLKRAKVYFSVMGEASEIKTAQAGLESAKGYIKRMISRRLYLRYVPELLFIYDESLELGSEIEKLFERLKKKDEPKEG